jgi:ribosomal protein L11
MPVKLSHVILQGHLENLVVALASSTPFRSETSSPEGVTRVLTFVAQKKMPPKVDPGATVELILRTIGGEPANMATLAPKLGPLGVPPKKASDVIQVWGRFPVCFGFLRGGCVQEATKDWKGLRVTVKLIIQNRNPRVEIIASSTALILKALNEPPRDRKKVKGIKHDGNISLKV